MVALEEDQTVDVMKWALNADVGTRITYASRPARMPRDESPPSLGAAYAAHLAGLVFLAQRRNRKYGGWDYEATRISRPTAEKLKIIERARR